MPSVQTRELDSVPSEGPHSILIPAPCYDSARRSGPVFCLTLLVDCPNCGQHNPDDKRICWKCQGAIPPPPPPPKPPRTYLGLPVWGWVVFAAMFIGSFLVSQCNQANLLGG